MVDNDFDEYDFSDLDLLGSDEKAKTPKPPEEGVISAGPEPEEKSINPTLRKAIIAVTLFVVGMMGYHFISEAWQKKTVVAPVVEQPPVEQPALLQPKPLEPTPAPSDSDRRLSVLEMSVQSLHSAIEDLNSRIMTAPAQPTVGAGELIEFQNTLAQLSARIDEQNASIAKLMRSQAAQHKPKPAVPHVQAPRIQYVVKAVVPGRAWLLASNGTTLTVRSGSRIHGLGVVQEIDAQQGRVRLDTGRVLRFSPEDS